ncbi:hypothetical protein N008_00690 [Hymenobacter sp. APR13]|nr:hypothetical protein N008_00690 [Hymenobacter sp. APR13]
MATVLVMVRKVNFRFVCSLPKLDKRLSGLASIMLPELTIKFCAGMIELVAKAAV